jgi:type IV pilus assembly protein PilE
MERNSDCVKHLREITKNGFSLIELLCVLGLVGLLTALAYPSYNKHLMHARRLDGMSALLDLATRLEQYHLQTGTYQTATLGAHKTTDVLNQTFSPGGWYQLRITQATQTYYALTATPIKSYPKAADLMLDANGLESEI